MMRLGLADTETNWLLRPAYQVIGFCETKTVHRSPFYMPGAPPPGGEGTKTVNGEQ